METIISTNPKAEMLSLKYVPEALHGFGENVEDPAKTKPALDRAFPSGKPAVVNVIVEPTAAGVSRAWVGSRMEQPIDFLNEVYKGC